MEYVVVYYSIRFLLQLLQCFIYEYVDRTYNKAPNISKGSSDDGDMLHMLFRMVSAVGRLSGGKSVFVDRVQHND